MYDVAAMLKPGESFTLEEMESLLKRLCHREKVDKTENGFKVTLDGAELRIAYSQESHVVIESNEIAKQFKIPCEGCTARYEMSGHDPNMDLFNTYLALNDQLLSTGKFISFDLNQGCLLFAD